MPYASVMQRPQSSHDSATGLKLMDAAERLFAESGIEAVSLNRITREADQRNASAPQYHFGSKMELVRAIFARRMQGINHRRLQLLDSVDERKRVAALRRVGQALVLPLAEQLNQGEGGRNYVRFASQVYADPRIDMFELVRGQHDEGVREVTRLVLSLLKNLPPEVARQRLSFVSSLFIHALAERARALSHEGRTPSDGEISGLASNLIDVVVAMLSCPASKETQTLFGSTPITRSKRKGQR